MKSSTTTNTLTFPQQLARLDLGRLKSYRDNLDFYQGAQWPEPARRRERRLIFNYAKTIIELLKASTLAPTRPPFRWRGAWRCGWRTCR
jgi:hypothetical protein